jgi:hypothetical protein
MLANPEAVIDAIGAAMLRAATFEDRKKLYDMRLLWEAEAAGYPSYVRHIRTDAVDVEVEEAAQ